MRRRRVPYITARVEHAPRGTDGTQIQLATILAALNDLLGPGGATWDPPVGSIEAVIPWRASYCPLSESVSHPVRPSSSASQGFHIFQIAFQIFLAMTINGGILFLNLL